MCGFLNKLEFREHIPCALCCAVHQSEHKYTNSLLLIIDDVPKSLGVGSPALADHIMCAYK